MLKNLLLPASYLTLMGLFTALFSYGQDKGMFLPKEIRAAVTQKTRTHDGTPGKRYWQNSASYNLEVSFDPASLLVKGSGTIEYSNNSPDTLNYLLLMLFPDLYREGNPRDFQVSPEDEHPGITIHELRIANQAVDTRRNGSSRMFYSGTSAWVMLPEPLAPGTRVSLWLSWEYPLNKGSHMRTGQVDPGSFFIAYWFPRLGVYDDIEGWNAYTYTGVGEFYNDFGEFDVKISAPRDFIVWATGELQNPGETLSPELLQRYRDARTTGKRVSIIDEAGLKGPLTIPAGSITWHYQASDVSDFAFALSDHYLWDAIMIRDGTGDGELFLNVAYNKESDDFHEVLSMAEKAIQYMVEDLPGLPFPYPSMTVFNGLDEMEYPMMVNDISYRDPDESFKLTAHEICHSYFPFLTGCNEREYAWMDEGLTSFFEYNMMKDLSVSRSAYPYFLEGYLEIAGTERDIPLITNSALVRAPDYYSIYYSKAVSFYFTLMEETGRDVFREAIREFAGRWAGKHPTGFDMMNTFTDVVGKDLSWLFDPWFFEFGSVDLGIADAREIKGEYDIDVERSGNLPWPLKLLITYDDGSSELITRKPDIWQSHGRLYTVRITTGKEISRLELIHVLPVDTDHENDSWQF